MSIPGHNIKQEIFYNLTTCFRCYKVEDHLTNQCIKPQDYKVCSECSCNEHYWRECTSYHKKCINCSGDHRTLAAKCPTRKEAIKKKRTANEKPTQTYSQAAQQNTQNTSTHQCQNITNETHAKIFTSMLHAHFANIASPGSFEKELNNMLTLNSLPNVKAHPNPQSRKIIANIYNETSKAAHNENDEQNMEETNTEEDTSPLQAEALQPQQKPAASKKIRP